MNLKRPRESTSHVPGNSIDRQQSNEVSNAQMGSIHNDSDPYRNKRYEQYLRLKGELGLFMSRENTRNPDVYLEIKAANYRDGVHHVLRHVLLEAHYHLKHKIIDTNTEKQIENVALQLTHGVAVMTYLKLRAINIYRAFDNESFLLKPKVPAHFEVPIPFSYAISQLGSVEVSSLPKRMVCYPTAGPTDASTFLLPDGTIWSQTAYTDAVQYAKCLGMQFTAVDVNVQEGTAWWLFKQCTEDDIFTLRCILPEDNYTEVAAVVHSLYCTTSHGVIGNEIFDLSSLPDSNYGSFLRAPRDNISISSYNAIFQRPIR